MKNKKDIIIQIICYIMAIASIFTAGIWYLSLILSITTIVLSVKLIRKNGSMSAKATMIISMLGIIACVLVYGMTIASIASLYI